VEWLEGRRIGGSFGDSEIPLPSLLLCLLLDFEGCLLYVGTNNILDQLGGHIQFGSLAGAAHLLNCNADALRLTRREQKSLVD
jgi:hypothetical protein